MKSPKRYKFKIKYKIQSMPMFTNIYDIVLDAHCIHHVIILFYGKKEKREISEIE